MPQANTTHSQSIVHSLLETHWRISLFYPPSDYPRQTLLRMYGLGRVKNAFILHASDAEPGVKIMVDQLRNRHTLVFNNVFYLLEFKCFNCCSIPVWFIGHLSSQLFTGDSCLFHSCCWPRPYALAYLFRLANVKKPIFINSNRLIGVAFVNWTQREADKYTQRLLEASIYYLFLQNPRKPDLFNLARQQAKVCVWFAHKIA